MSNTYSEYIKEFSIEISDFNPIGSTAYIFLPVSQIFFIQLTGKICIEFICNSDQNCVFQEYFQNFVSYIPQHSGHPYITLPIIYRSYIYNYIKNTNFKKIMAK